jgi:hypothetical protein
VNKNYNKRFPYFYLVMGGVSKKNIKKWTHMFPHYLVMMWVVKNEIKNDHRCPTTSIWWWVEFINFFKMKIMCCTHLFGDGNFISHNTIKIIKQGSIPIDGGEKTTKVPQKGKSLHI